MFAEVVYNYVAFSVILSCHKESPISPLTTSQLSELISHGIIVLYQPNLPLLPTNFQDIVKQTHDIQSTDADDSESLLITSASILPSFPELFTSPYTQFADGDGLSQHTVADSGYSGTASSYLMSSSLKELQEPGRMDKKWHMDKELPLTMEERIAGKKRDIEYWKRLKADYQQDPREAEERVRCLKLIQTQTSDPAGQRELKRKIHDAEEWIKRWKKDIQRCQEKINRDESDLLVLNEAKDKGLSRHQTTTGNTSSVKECSLATTLNSWADKREIERLKYLKADRQQRQREAEEDVRRLKSRLAQTSDPKGRRELERNIHDEEEKIKRWKGLVQLCEECINREESDLLSSNKTKDKEFDQSVFNSLHVSMALTDLIDWHKLGQILGLKKIKLDQIRVVFNKYGNARLRDEMVDLWLYSDRDASWEKLCTALENMDQNKIADQIRRRYSK